MESFPARRIEGAAWSEDAPEVNIDDTDGHLQFDQNSILGGAGGTLLLEKSQLSRRPTDGHTSSWQRPRHAQGQAVKEDAIAKGSYRMTQRFQAMLLVIACLALVGAGGAQVPAGAPASEPSALPDSPTPAASRDSGQRASVTTGASHTEADLRAQLTRNPASVPALTALAALLAQSGHPRPAAELWRRAAALLPQDAGLQQSLAQALMDAGLNREAAATLKVLTAEHPDLEPAQLALGLALARDNRFTEAIPPLQAALRLRPDEDIADLSLAKVLVTLLRYDEATRHVQNYARQHPHSFDAHYLLGLIASKTNQPAIAERELAAAGALDPKNYEVQVNLGRVLAGNGKPMLAVEHFQAAVALRASLPETHYELARIYRELGDKPKSDAELAQMRACREGEAVDRQVAVLENQGAEALEKGASAEASQFYLKAIALHPADIKAHENLALAYGQAGRVQDEQAELEKAASLDHGDASVMSLLGELAARAGKADRARALFREALASDPDNAAALCGLGVLTAQAGYLAEAEVLLQRSLESDPEYVEGYRNLGLVLAAEKRYSEAGAALHRSLEGGGEHGLAWTALGRLAIAQGDLPSAVDAFRSAVTSAPACSPVRVEFAAALAQQRHLESALAALDPVGDGCPAPEAAEAHVERAGIFCALKRSREARSEWQTAQRLAPTGPGPGDFHCP